MPFDPNSGEGVSATPIGESYQAVVGDVLTEFMKNSENVYALTPATPYASGIEDLMKNFSDAVTCLENWIADPDVTTFGDISDTPAEVKYKSAFEKISKFFDDAKKAQEGISQSMEGITNSLEKMRWTLKVSSLIENNREQLSDLYDESELQEYHKTRQSEVGKYTSEEDTKYSRCTFERALWDQKKQCQDIIKTSSVWKSFV